MAKDAKGHGSEARGTAPGYAGRDKLGRTYTQAIRDHDRFPAQNPSMPDAGHYKSAADALAAPGHPKSDPVPVHPAHEPVNAWGQNAKTAKAVRKQLRQERIQRTANKRSRSY